MEDSGFGACSELIFAPVDKKLPNDAVVLSSGFRIFFLGTDTVELQFGLLLPYLLISS